MTGERSVVLTDVPSEVKVTSAYPRDGGRVKLTCHVPTSAAAATLLGPAWTAAGAFCAPASNCRPAKRMPAETPITYIAWAVMVTSVVSSEG